MRERISPSSVVDMREYGENFSHLYPDNNFLKITFKLHVKQFV